MAIDVNGYYLRYGPMVYRHCLKLLGDDSRAEDVMQDVFVELIRAEKRLAHLAPSSLLYRIATNRCLNELRTQRRRREDGMETLLQRIASSDDVDTRSTAKIMIDTIFGRERESTRTMAVMHLVEGMTLQEVAQETGLSVSGVRKRLRTLNENVREMEGLEP